MRNIDPGGDYRSCIALAAGVGVRVVGDRFRAAWARLHFLLWARRAWLVDALTATSFDGQLESVFSRGQVIMGAMTLSGSAAGGLLAQLTNLGVPYLVRTAILIGMFALALIMMHDLGFTPARGARPS